MAQSSLATCLTTSDTPGHVMKATDYKLAQGAIIGKAMSSLNKGHLTGTAMWTNIIRKKV